MHPYRSATVERSLFAAWLVGAAFAPPAVAQSSVSLVQLPPAYGGNLVLAGDGRTIVGTTRSSTGAWSAFRWTQQSGVQAFALPAFGDAWVGGASHDGSSFFITTRPDEPNPPRTSWIVQNQTLLSVARPAGSPDLLISSISRDGNWVAGSDGGHVFRRPISGNWAELPVSVPAGYSASVQLSADGSVAAGSIVNTEFSIYSGFSFRWTGDSGAAYTHAPAPMRMFMGSLSPDGSTIFGGFDPGIDSNLYPIFQREGAGLRGFSNPQQSAGFMFRFSNEDASVLIASGGMYSETYRWTEATDLMPMSTVYASAGIALDGYQLGFPIGASDDARTILWDAYRPSDASYRLALITIPAPGISLMLPIGCGRLAMRRRRLACA